MTVWPLSLADVQDSRRRIRPYLSPTPARHYPALDALLGHGTRVFVKHENHNPTNNFKVRNGLSVLTALSDDERGRGVVAASRGNHGSGLAWAGLRLGVSVTICVPRGNNPEKNEMMRSLGARLVERGDDYDDAVLVAEELSRESGLRVVHSTNDRQVLAGAGTISLEILEQVPDAEAIVVALGGGSQAVGALTVARELRPGLKVYAVQTDAARTIHDSWHARKPTIRPLLPTIADGLATREVYELTFGTLCEGLAGFTTVSESEIADAIRTVLRTTHNLVEGAGAAGLAGLLKLRDLTVGRTVAIILSGSNIDQTTLRRVLAGEL